MKSQPRGGKPIKAWAVFGINSKIPWLFECRHEAQSFQDVITRATGGCQHNKAKVLQVTILTRQSEKEK